MADLMIADVPPASFSIDAELVLPMAHLQIAQIDHPEPHNNAFQQDGIYWVDLCLTPRRPSASARYIDHWSVHRTVELGGIMALPPSQRISLASAGGRHASLICRLQSGMVDRHLAADFEWTDRRLEACLNIASDPIRLTLLRLNQEVRMQGLASRELSTALVTQLAIDFARYLIGVSEPDETGGLATWRQRIIEETIATAERLPSVAELADLCKISERQLRRAFRTSHGCSLVEHIAQVRLDRAKRKLHSREAIRDIASALGYSSQSNFTSAFRKGTGTTPAQYRRRVKAGKAALLARWPHD